MPAKKKDIEEYNSKRRFDETAEPKGRKAKAHKLPVFVVQKHDASRLHYDFRLEVDGVLASWAVPKGPTLVPGVRRLAAHVEDHPLDYANFEGVIPEGNYGAGEVIVWDRGTYRNLLEEKTGKAKRTMRQAIEDGKVEVWLDGEKLKGGFVLVRTRDEKDEWLLMKMHDEHARESGEITKTKVRSVISDKKVEEIGENGRVWGSNRKTETGKKSKSVSA